jgi:cytochrome c oxidase assembly protein subunit 19
MAKDEFKNLGFGEDKPAEETKKGSDAEKGAKGELRW